MAGIRIEVRHGRVVIEAVTARPAETAAAAGKTARAAGYVRGAFTGVREVWYA